VYELHLINPTTAELHESFIVHVITELLAGLTAGTIGGGGPIAKLTLEVVDVRSGQPVVTMPEYPTTAQSLAKTIEADLDRLDAIAFAKEWGIEPNSG